MLDPTDIGRDRLRSGHVDDPDPVMLVVVAKEAYVLILERNFGVEDGLVPTPAGLVMPAAQDDMGQLAWPDPVLSQRCEGTPRNFYRSLAHMPSLKADVAMV
jgi:hypothetical protein